MGRRSRRKLLVASVGIASVSYVLACGKNHPVSGNLPAPDPVDASATPTTTPSTEAGDAGETTPVRKDAGN